MIDAKYASELIAGDLIDILPLLRLIKWPNSADIISATHEVATVGGTVTRDGETTVYTDLANVTVPDQFVFAFWRF